MKRTIGAIVLILSVPAGLLGWWILCVALFAAGLVLTKDGPCPRCGSDRCLKYGRCGR